MTRIALVIGINDYTDASLDYCVSDAQAVSDVLEAKEFGFKTKLLLDGDATRKSILREIEAVRIQRPEVFLFYFAGHGCSTPRGTFLVSHDGEPLDEGLEFDLLGKIFATFSDFGSSVISILDCCHSGSATPWNVDTRPMNASEPEKLVLARASNRVILAACRPDELSFEEDKFGHGLFTFHLLHGLAGEAANAEGTITINGIYDYVCKPFQEVTHQNPVFRADISGTLALGIGFVPIKREVIEEDRFASIEIEGGRIIDDYLAKPNLNLRDWKAFGYKESAAALEPIIRWVDKQVEQYPQLINRKKFRDIRGATRNRLAQLGSIDIGTVIPEGIVTEKIGEGAFGSVWKVVPENSNYKPLAYKIYHPHDLGLEDKKSRFFRGYRAMKQLNHPFIVKVHNYNECPIGFFMDFINGPNFRQVSSGIGEPIDKINFIYTIAQTVRHAHDRQIIHRDIKPENVIAAYDNATNQWRPHLTDFDLAWFSTATQLTKDAMGTTFYAAPEQLSAPLSRVAHQATVDVYSFGQLLYFLIVGADPIPLGLANNLKALEKQLSGWPSEFSARIIRQIYQECSEQRPEKRLNNFALVEDMLGTIMSHLRSDNRGTLLSVEQYFSELVFSLVGFLPTSFTAGEPEFSTLSGRTSIHVRAKETMGVGKAEKILLEVKLRPTSSMFMEGVSNDKARTIINSRVDEAIRPFDKASRRSGKSGSYEVFVDIGGVFLNGEGLDYCRPIIARVIAAVEKS